jgi:hypothetical protein
MGSPIATPNRTLIYDPLPKNGVYGDKELGKLIDEFNSYIPKLKGLSPVLKNVDLKFRDGQPLDETKHGNILGDAYNAALDKKQGSRLV